MGFMRISLWLKLIILTAFGLLIVEYARYDWLVHIGNAMMVAGIMGLVIDYALKLDIAKEVFETAFGYLLPPEIKEETRWVYGLKLLAIEADYKYTIDFCSDKKNHVIVTEQRYRVIQNNHNETVDVPVYIGVRDWFSNFGKSTIEEFYYHLDDEEKTIVKTRKAGDECHVIADAGIVKLKPKHTITIYSLTKEIRQKNDMIYSVSSATATKNPTITINAPPEIGTKAAVLSREINREYNSGFYKYNGVLLPHQPIIIRWWDKEEEKSWREAF